MHRKQIRLVNDLTELAKKLEDQYRIAKRLTRDPELDDKLQALSGLKVQLHRAMTALEQGKRAVVGRKAWSTLQRLHKQCTQELKDIAEARNQQAEGPAPDYPYFSFEPEIK